jgi:hypothetical protein
MKTHPVLVCLVLALMTLAPSKSQAVIIPKESMQHKVVPLLREDPNRISHWVEARIGPRFSWLHGDIRPGGDGSSKLDIQDDLGLKDPSMSVQIDLEMQVSDKWHASLNYSGNDFEGSATPTTRTLFYHSPTNPPQNANTQSNPAVLPQGSTLQTKITIDTLNAFLRYDVYKDKYWLIQPMMGAKMVILDETLLIHNIATGATTINNQNILQAMPMLGFDARCNVRKDTYLGWAPYAFAWENFVYTGGQVYAGYDFSKSWALRLGLDYDLISLSRDQGSQYSTTSSMLAAFVQAVYGW